MYLNNRIKEKPVEGNSRPKNKKQNGNDKLRDSLPIPMVGQVARKNNLRKEKTVKKKLILTVFLAVLLAVSVTAPVLAWDKEDPCVASNKDFWNVNGWDNGVQQTGPEWECGYEPFGQIGEQHPYWVDPETDTLLVATGYNLYRDDVSGSGNLDEVVFRTDTPNEINLDDAYLTDSKHKSWKNDKRVSFWKLTYESPGDACWYWAKEPRGINYPEPVEPIKKPDPNRFIVAMRFGYDRSEYLGESNNTLRYSIKVDGEYDGTQYMLVIPKGCVIERLSGKRLYSLFLKEVSGDMLTFAPNDAEFSEPCVLYVAEGGRIYEDRMGEQIGDGEWVELGTFTSIVDGEAHLD